MVAQNPVSVPDDIIDIDRKEMEALKVLKRLIEDDEDLKDLPIKDDFLLPLLRSRHCKSDWALETIKTIIEYKDKTYPEIFTKVRPECIKHVLDKKCVQVVKRKIDSGPAVMVFKTGKWNPLEVSFDDLIMAGLMYSYEVAIKSIEIQRKGVILIVDVGHFGFRHARQCTYGRVMRMANCVIFGSPIRIVGCYFVQSPYIFEKVYKVAKFAIPEGCRSYITVTKSDLSRLHELVSPEMLPTSLGGEVPEDEGWETDLEESILKNQEVFKLFCQISPKSKAEGKKEILKKFQIF